MNIWLRGEIGNGPLAATLAGAEFTVSELREVYEAIWATRIGCPFVSYRTVTGHSLP